MDLPCLHQLQCENHIQTIVTDVTDEAFLLKNKKEFRNAI